MRCPSCDEENESHEDYCGHCGHDLASEPEPEGDSTGGLIPYKNPKALIAYYLGLFSIFPVLGLFMAIAALFLGRRGLADVKEQPVIKGQVHAWIGIGCGSIGLLFNLVLVGVVIVALAARR